MDADKTIIAGRQSVTAGDSCHYLVGVSGTMAGQRIEIPTGSSTVGRRDGATIRILDPAVSGRHCRIDLVPLLGLMIIDLGSSNGTYIDEKPVSEPQPLPIGSFLQVGTSLFKHELRSRQEVLAEQALEGDLEKAAAYVKNLLPLPIDEEAVATEWRFIPSAKLGGDAFGYHWLDDDHFAIYLADVCGHGTAPALHSVSVINVLRKRSLPQVDFKQPDQVLTALNNSFQMSEHGNLYFTFWYSIYRPSTRKLAFATAGHPPSFLIGSEPDQAQKLMTKNFAIGMMPDATFVSDEVTVPENSRLYVYSDGAYEIVTEAGEEWRVDDFFDLLTSTPAAEVDEPQRVERAVRQVMIDSDFEDDFSLLVTRFP